MGFIFPSRVTRVSDDFADHVARNSVNPGIDFVTPSGTPVWATGAGVVKVADGNPDGAGGRMVVISHGAGVTSEYLHLQRVTVKVGDKVKQHQEIGLSGGSGFGKENGYAPHLHYAHKVKGVNKDFMAIMAAQVKRAKAKAAKAAKG
jgi:murein DD-endopeptidase